ncbi:multidrug efflux SMR transporter [Bacillus mycoides]|uniref:DMT family transporter n=1 Tax=Bacillus TaxID=1386 RepID=UPI0010BF358A|nr:MULTISPECIES: multidrug efflux SMR transporter [Bacillus cereus group]MEC5239466.1 multidrug efflux SMR transporter [Bacillus mycoides]MEC5264249.1 multidrug efflux SMR transporter [Bacillus mycoides]QEL87376.1 QacE family quaternary ammonium compound efflux SMR transporter [Bacillus mycoides]QWH63143.1 multidrug efflux SMR transporter [Bacillus mycoides]TKI43161.1 multidrug efflux SMR transporter [Bacillus mycoides]
MAWMYLIIAGLFEIVGVIGIKKVTKDNNWTNNIILIGGFIISFQFLTMALQEIQLSIAYAVWTGIGTLGAAVVGILFFKEPKNAFRIICIVGIMGTIIGLKVVS